MPPGGTPSCIPSPITVSGGLAPPPPTMREIYVMPADELPDYRPPFSPGADARRCGRQSVDSHESVEADYRAAWSTTS